MSEEKFCKLCGKEISKYFKLCPYCGEKVEEEILEIYCSSCGKYINSDFRVCPYCGNNPNNQRENYNNYNNYNTENRTNYYSNNYEISPKKGIVCFLLLIFLPPFHRFYAGKKDSAFFLLGCYILLFSSLVSGVTGKFYSIYLVFISIILPVVWIIDLVLIISGKFKDSQGRYIKLRN